MLMLSDCNVWYIVVASTVGRIIKNNLFVPAEQQIQVKWVEFESVDVCLSDSSGLNMKGLDYICN